MLERLRRRAAEVLAPEGVGAGLSASPADGGQQSNLTGRAKLGTVADVIAVVSALGSSTALIFGRPATQAILAVTLGLLALVFMALSFSLQRQLAREVQAERRRARHGQSLFYLQQSTSELRNAAARMELGEHPSTFSQPAQQACASLATAMTTATGRVCRVVVKTLYAPGGREDVAVKTFTSSETSVPRKDSAQPPAQDWVKENTDFDEIFYQNADFFLSNDLEHERGYKNSHFTKQSLINGYPYLSTIVWPIYGPEGGQDGGWDILGFLCVDTKEPNSFDPSVDVLVGQVLAPVWYLALQRYEAATELADSN